MNVIILAIAEVANTLQQSDKAGYHRTYAAQTVGIADKCK